MSIDREQLIQDFFTNFAVLKRQGSSNFSRVAGKTMLPPSQREVLHLVYRTQPLNLKELARMMQLTPGAVTQLVETLVQAGLVVRSADPADRRIQLISLSDEGNTKMAEIKKLHENRAREMASILSDQELQAMHDIQKKMIDYYTKQHSQTSSDKKKEV